MTVCASIFDADHMVAREWEDSDHATLDVHTTSGGAVTFWLPYHIALATANAFNEAKKAERRPVSLATEGV